jgi:broad specificity phosphatase PhoE
MSELLLVRHGQSGADGLLTVLGEQQAQELGRYWSARGQSFDEAYCGALPRQRRTAELAAWPSAIEMPDLNEYDASGIVGKLGARLAIRDREYAALVQAWEKERVNRTFQRMFEVVVRKWVEGTLADPSVESWPAFRERARQALRRLTQEGPSRQVVAFTSGGVIGVMVQTVLDAPDTTAIELNWRVRNGSLTGFLFSGDRISLDYFNATPYLEDSEITYR